jgi:hypothetical protein
MEEGGEKKKPNWRGSPLRRETWMDEKWEEKEEEEKRCKLVVSATYTYKKRKNRSL